MLCLFPSIIFTQLRSKPIFEKPKSLMPHRSCFDPRVGDFEKEPQAVIVTQAQIEKDVLGTFFI